MSTAVTRATGKAPYQPDEMMTIAAARRLADGMSVFVGIGLPSVAANLARVTHAPRLTLVYESGPIGSKPTRLPLSIGDGELATTADAVVSIPEMFNYWLQPGRIDLGYLGAAQIDKMANLNTTLIGDSYSKPSVRLPGAGGAPEIASFCKEVTILLRHARRSFVDKVDFVTTVGFGAHIADRRRWGLNGAGPTTVITDLGVLEPDEDGELVLVATHPGVTVSDVKEHTSWDVRVASEVVGSEPPTAQELEVLRSLNNADH